MEFRNCDYVYYGVILSKKEIVNVGLVISSFENGKISYRKLEEEFSQLGINVIPLLKGCRNAKKIWQVEYFNKLNSSKILTPRDIDGYILSFDEYKNILVRYDRYMLENLYEFGDENAIRLLDKLTSLEETKVYTKVKKKEG